MRTSHKGIVLAKMTIEMEAQMQLDVSPNAGPYGALLQI
jgi:hypothetical protein